MVGNLTVTEPVLATSLSSVATWSNVGTSLDIWKICNLMSISKSEGAMTSSNGLVRDTVDHVNVILSPTWIGSSWDLMSTWLSSSMRPTYDINQK